jgi:SAM-dependent methyltransferase
MNWRFWRPPAAPPPTPSETYDSGEHWRREQQLETARNIARQAEYAGMLAAPPPSLEALCVTCAQPRRFTVEWHGRPDPGDPREGLVCPSCRLNSRQRTALGLLRDRTPDPQARVYSTEQISPVYLWLRRRYANAIGSEFQPDPARVSGLSLWLARHGLRESIRDLDVTALALDSASLDAIASFDVLEHVPDYTAALAEFARCLRPGGTLVLTAPFNPHTEQTVVRARLADDGSIEHLLPPEIHGDPLSDGVLCWYHFGWDVLDRCRDAGFDEAAWHYSWDPGQALFGMWTLVARKRQ